MQWLRYLLLPFSWLYGLGVRLRNWLFDRNIKPVKTFSMHIIGIGNLSAGGTGKTPMTEYVLKLLLQNGHKPAMLSRGYRRQSNGFQIVKPYSTADFIGDEPLQVKRKLPDVFVAVCEDRATGIEKIQEASSASNVIVMDDSYQHRKVKPGFNILLTDYNKPFYEDLLLPSGMLREPKKGKERADVIIVTKCPENMSLVQKQDIHKKIKPEPNQQVYFTSITYHSLRKAMAEAVDEPEFPIASLKGYVVLLFSGIAKTKPLLDFLKSHGIETVFIKFADHHSFSNEDMMKIRKKWDAIPKMNKLVITTEKDWRRMEGTDAAKYLVDVPFYFIPIEVQWGDEDKQNFDNQITQYVGADK